MDQEKHGARRKGGRKCRQRENKIAKRLWAKLKWRCDQEAMLEASAGERLEDGTMAGTY
jgi:hypothetical protein